MGKTVIIAGAIYIALGFVYAQLLLRYARRNGREFGFIEYIVTVFGWLPYLVIVSGDGEDGSAER